MQTYLHRASEVLNDTVPQTVPQEILDIFNDKLLQSLHDHYSALLQKDNEENAFGLQNISLQIYFDIIFLQNAFVFGREKKESFNALRNLCRENIDPFDFELWSTHLLSNAKGVVNRYTSLFGLLTPLANQTNNTTVVNASPDKDPNVLSLCSSSATTLWFPLLPVVADVSSPGEEDVPIIESKPPNISEKQVN